MMDPDPVRTAVDELCGQRGGPFFHAPECRCARPADHPKQDGHRCPHGTVWTRSKFDL